MPILYRNKLVNGADFPPIAVGFVAVVAGSLGGQRFHRICRFAPEGLSNWTGISVYVGIRPTKALSKLAELVAKKCPRARGVFNYNALTIEQNTNLLQNIPVEEVVGL